MSRPSLKTPARLAAAFLLSALLGACGVLSQVKAPQPAFYVLDGAPTADLPATRAALPKTPGAPTLIVNPPHAAAGFDSQHIIYVREPHQLEYFAHSEWADTPARMLAPLIVAALAKDPAFAAVVPTPSTAIGKLRLDVEIVRLQHEFDHSPSRVRLTLRAYLVDTETRRVLGWQAFEEVVEAARDTPYGGVVAGNEAARKVIDRLVAFCAALANDRRP